MKTLSILSMIFLVSCNGGGASGSQNESSKSTNNEPSIEFIGDIEELSTVEYHTSCINGSNTYYRYRGNGVFEVKYNRYEENDCINQDAFIPMLTGTFDFHGIEYTCNIDGNILNCDVHDDYYTWMVDHFNTDINTWDVMSCIDDHANLNLQAGAPNREDGDCVESSAQFVLSGTKENLVINGQQLNYVE